VFLIGCETAAVGSDLASAFLSGGARGIIGSFTVIPLDVAEVFFESFLRSSVDDRLPVDYAFFFARREAVLYEILTGMGHPHGTATAGYGAQLAHRHIRFSDILEELSTSWPEVRQHTVYSLSLTLLGAAGEMLT